MPKLSDGVYEKIVTDYLSGMTQKEVGKLSGMGRNSVGRILKRLNIERREYTGERDSARKWDWDFDFFTKQNPIVSYWAGFCIADGNINNKGNIMALVISEKDVEHIFRFCDDIGLDREAIFRQENALGVHLGHKNLGNSLLSWGIVPRKSKNFHAPQISIDMLPHLLRGWIDGDGSVYRHGRSARVVVASGNKESLDWFVDALRLLGYEGNASVKEVVYTPYPGNYTLYIGGRNQVSEICKILMVDECFCMDRKWQSTYNEKRKKEIRLCEWCEIEFEIDLYRAKNEPENGKFCSKSCFHEYQRLPKTQI